MPFEIRPVPAGPRAAALARALVLTLVLALGLAAAPPAAAQDLSRCPQGLGGGSTNVVFGFTCARLPDAFVDTRRTEQVATARTQVVGRLQGVDTPLYDVSWLLPFSDPIVQAGLDAARQAIDAASDDPLDILGPTLELRTLGNSSTIGPTVLLEPPQVSEAAVVQFFIGPDGPAPTGNLGRCTGTTAQGLPTGCTGGDPLFVDVFAGQQALVTNLLYTFTFTRETLVTETTETFERWALLGVPVGPVPVPAPATGALLALGMLGWLGARELRRRAQGIARNARSLLALAVTGAALLAAPIDVHAQGTTVCPRGDQGSSSNVLVTATCARLPDAFVDVPVTRRTDVFRTQIVGVLDGVGTFYDTTFAAPFLDPIVQAGLDAARSAIDLASDDPLDFGAPLRTDASVLLLSSSVGAPQVVGDPLIDVSVALELIIGAGFDTFARSGDLGRCLGTTALGFPDRCSGGDPLVIRVLPGQQAVVTHLLSTWTFTREIVTTQTWETFERWQVVGTPRDADGQVPLPGSLGLLGAGLLAIGSARAAARRRRSG
jgi:hypothetical protein